MRLLLDLECSVDHSGVNDREILILEALQRITTGQFVLVSAEEGRGRYDIFDETDRYVGSALWPDAEIKPLEESQGEELSL